MSKYKTAACKFIASKLMTSKPGEPFPDMDVDPIGGKKKEKKAAGPPGPLAAPATPTAPAIPTAPVTRTAPAIPTAPAVGDVRPDGFTNVQSHSGTFSPDGTVTDTTTPEQKLQNEGFTNVQSHSGTFSPPQQGQGPFPRANARTNNLSPGHGVHGTPEAGDSLYNVPQGKNHPANQQPDGKGRSPFDPDYDPITNPPKVAPPSAAAAAFSNMSPEIQRGLFGGMPGTPENPGVLGYLKDKMRGQPGAPAAGGQPGADINPGGAEHMPNLTTPDKTSHGLTPQQISEQERLDPARAGGGQPAAPAPTRPRSEMSPEDQQEYDQATSGFTRPRSEMSPEDQQEFDQAGAPFGISKGGSANNLMHQAIKQAAPEGGAAGPLEVDDEVDWEEHLKHLDSLSDEDKKEEDDLRRDETRNVDPGDPRLENVRDHYSKDAAALMHQAIKQAAPAGKHRSDVMGSVHPEIGGPGEMMSRGMSRKQDKGKGVNLNRVQKRRNRQYDRGKQPSPPVGYTDPKHERSKSPFRGRRDGSQPVKQAGYWSEYFSGFNPLNWPVGGLIGSGAALATPTRDLRQQAESDESLFKNLLIPGVGPYNAMKRLGTSIRGPELKEERRKLEEEREEERRARRGYAASAPRDGDGDGVINDGEPDEKAAAALMRKAAAMAPMMRNALIGGAGAATVAGLGTMFAGKEDEEGQEGPSRAQRAIRNALLAGGAGVAGGAGLTAAGLLGGADAKPPAAQAAPALQDPGGYDQGLYDLNKPGPSEGPTRWKPGDPQNLGGDGGTYQGENLGHGEMDVIEPNLAAKMTGLETHRQDLGERVIDTLGGPEDAAEATDQQMSAALAPELDEAQRYYMSQPAAQAEATAIFNPNSEMAGGGEYRSRRQMEMDVAIRKRKDAARARKAQRDLESGAGA